MLFLPVMQNTENKNTAVKQKTSLKILTVYGKGLNSMKKM